MSDVETEVQPAGDDEGERPFEQHDPAPPATVDVPAEETAEETEEDAG